NTPCLHPVGNPTPGPASLKNRLQNRPVDRGLVSSHLMSEMENTAAHLVVIGKGRLIAAESLEDFAARGAHQSAIVRTPDVAALRTILVEAGASVEPHTDNSLTVTGLSAARIGDLAFQNMVPVHELTPHTASLEAAFMEVTADSVEYAAGDAR
ncbi:ABC transporter ATP-binding protein, partial [Streptomyces sp. NPDC088554]